MALGVVLEGDKVDGPPIVAEAPNPAMALAIMGFFSTCGLLYGYLWTRYEEAVTSDAAGDATALALVNRWLNLHPAPDDQTRLDMMDAVKSASSAARMRIFLQAEQYRKVSNRRCQRPFASRLSGAGGSRSGRNISSEQKPIRACFNGENKGSQES